MRNITIPLYCTGCKTYEKVCTWRSNLPSFAKIVYAARLENVSARLNCQSGGLFWILNKKYIVIYYIEWYTERVWQKI
jgi:hypothetical protein